MGHKVHPTGIRLGISKDWNSTWYSGKKDFASYLAADLKVREMLREKLAAAGISRIQIERPAKTARVTIHTARPGVVIGKKGEDIEKLRKDVSDLMGVPTHITASEVRKPELDAQLVAERDHRQGQEAEEQRDDHEEDRGDPVEAEHLEVRVGPQHLVGPQICVLEAEEHRDAQAHEEVEEGERDPEAADDLVVAAAEDGRQAARGGRVFGRCLGLRCGRGVGSGLGDSHGSARWRTLVTRPECQKNGRDGRCDTHRPCSTRTSTAMAAHSKVRYVIE